MLRTHIAAAIGCARGNALDEIMREVWTRYGAGQLSDDEAGVIALDARSLVVLRDHEDDTPETDHSVAASLAALTTPIDLVPAQAPTVELPH